MRKALSVGINEYPGAPLTGCVHDALRMQAVLATQGDGSPNFSVRLMTSPSTSITRRSLREALHTLFQGDSDIALFYFSGHGTQTPTGGYVVTPDASQYDEGISMDEILTLANGSSARDKIVILDCCHSGSFGARAVTGSNTSQLGNGLTVLTACRDFENAMEIDGQGVFTSLLLDALDGGAADLRGNITPGGLYSYVDEALGAWDQRPIFKTNISKFVAIRKVQAPIPADTLRKITTYFPSADHEHSLDPSYEFTDPRHNQDNVKIFKDLQKYESVGLVKPVGEQHMYFAAMNSKSCKLTAMGHQYWRLVSEGKI